MPRKGEGNMRSVAMRVVLGLVVAGLGLGASGCGDDDGGVRRDGGGDLDAGDQPDGGPTLDGGPPGLTFATFPDAMARAFCAQYFACCDGSERDDIFDGDPPADEAECVTILRVTFTNEYSEVGALIASGDIVFDPTRGAACVATFGDVACEAFTDEYYAPVCLAAFEGQQQDGDACSLSVGCAPLLYCGGDGTCAPRAAVTESCAAAPCAAGFYCDLEDICRPQVENGSSCTFDQACTSGFCDTIGTAQAAGGGACAPPPPLCEVAAG